MAPEQTQSHDAPDGRAEATSPAVDIYALGAILYECLTGRPPFQGIDALDTLLQVRLIDAVPVRRLAPAVPHDLETVCSKCLAKSPRGRYSSARELGDDLRRFLAGEPVRARPISLPERAVKWGRRNPTLAACAILAAALAGALVLGVGYHIRRLHESLVAMDAERERTRSEAARAEQNLEAAFHAVNVMLLKVGSDRLNGIPQSEPVRRELLEEAGRFYSQLGAQRSNDPRLRRLEAGARLALGRLRIALGQRAEAEADLRAAAKALDALADSDAGRAADRRESADARHRLAELLFEQPERIGESVAEARAALAGLERLAREWPGDPGDRLRVAVSQLDLAAALASTSAPAAEIRPLLQAAFGEISALRRDGVPGAETAWARAQLRLAQLEMTAGQLANVLNRAEAASAALKAAPADEWTVLTMRIDAERLRASATLALGTADPMPIQASAAELAGQLARLAPHRADVQLAHAEALIDLAAVESNRGRRDDAAGRFRQAAEILEGLHRRDPAYVVYRRRLALVQFNMGQCRDGQGETAQAAMRRGCELADAIVRDHPDMIDFAVEAASYRAGLAQVELRNNRPSQAVAALRSAADVQARACAKSPNQPEWLSALAQTQELLANALPADEALAVRRQVIATRERLLALTPDNADATLRLAGELHNLALALEGAPLAERLELLDRALAMIGSIRARLPHYEPAVRFSVIQYGFRAELRRLAGRHADADADGMMLPDLCACQPAMHQTAAMFLGRQRDVARRAPGLDEAEREHVRRSLGKRAATHARDLAQAGLADSERLRRQLGSLLGDVPEFRTLLSELDPPKE